MNKNRRILTFLRHGETLGNKEGILMGGLMDLPLTPEGEMVSKGMAEYIQKMGFDVIFCSPNQRALTTMELACK